MQSVPLLPVVFDVVTPVGAWVPGQTWPPPATQARAARMQLYRELFSGDFRQLSPVPMTLQLNYFRRATLFLAELLSAYPIEITGGVPPEYIDGLTELVTEAVHTVVVDQTMHGSGFLRSRAEAGVPIVEAVDPRWVFPLPGNAGAVLAIPDTANPGDPQLDVIMLHRESVAHSRFALSPGSTLSSVLGTEQLLGRFPAAAAPTIEPVPRRPATGGWGVSMYDDMVPMVLELSHRFTTVSGVLDRHAEPVVALKRNDRYFNDDPTDDEETAEVRLTWERERLSALRSHPVIVLPEEFDDAHYLTWDAQMQANAAHVELVKDALFAVTSIPSALFGMAASGFVSGSSLKKLYAPTYLYVRDLQAQLTNQIKRRIAQALTMAGSPADPSGVTFEWPHPLEELDTVTVVQTSDPNAAEPAQVAGGELSEDGVKADNQ